MEIHKHPHHITHKKKWTEYLLEFFMLFLAVFLGFVAENIREESVEHSRKKVLALALYKDMQHDTTQLNFITKFRTSLNGHMDSIYTMIKRPAEQVNARSFYRSMITVNGFFNYSPAPGTINQLKAAGYLRYFSGTALPGLLSDYEFELLDHQGVESREAKWKTEEYLKLTNLRIIPEDIFDYYYLNGHFPDKMGIPVFPANLRQELIANLVYLKFLNNGMIEANEKVKERIMKILEFLKKEYTIKE